jgi:hypothetical protein
MWFQRSCRERDWFFLVRVGPDASEVASVVLFELDGRDVVECLMEAAWLNQPMYSTTASSSCVRQRQTRSAMSSVLNESTNDSAIALS